MALSLKVFLVSANQYKMMRFMQDMSVNEVVKEIQEKTNVGGADHGLFMPPDPEKLNPGKWLTDKYTLLYYNLSNGVSTNSIR
jgi:hypothetical protein